jgi:hypothetical protein
MRLSDWGAHSATGRVRPQYVVFFFGFACQTDVHLRIFTRSVVMPTPDWSYTQCERWLYDRFTKQLRHGGFFAAEPSEKSVQRRFQVKKREANAQKSTLGKNWSRTDKGEAGKAVAFTIVNEKPVHTPEFAAQVLTPFTGIKPEYSKLRGQDQLKILECQLLDGFGKCIVGLNPECMWMLGPVKGLGRMAQKAVSEPYNYDLSTLTDNFRGSIACPEKYFNRCKATIETYLQPQYGMAMVGGAPKDKFQQPKKYHGYGDVTYIISFVESPLPCELQLHKIKMLFGKTSQEEWTACKLDGLLPYRERETILGIPGGLGHALLEIGRGFSGEIVEKSQLLSWDYYAACNADCRAPDKLREDIVAFEKMITGNWEHRDDFKHVQRFL